MTTHPFVLFEFLDLPGGLGSFREAADSRKFSMCTEGTIRNHDQDPRRAGCKNVGMHGQLGVMVWTQFHPLCVRLMQFQVVSSHLESMDARTFSVDSQRQFVGVCRCDRDGEIRRPASTQFEVINSARERGNRGVGPAPANAIFSLRYLGPKLAARRIHEDLSQASGPLLAELDRFAR